jgi:hypothetical protein
VAFWQLMEKTRDPSDEDGYRQIELLVEELVKLSVEDILDFDRIFDQFMDRAYSRNLMVAVAIFGFGGDDSFTDFRGWLIGQGKEIYERVLADPDSLADVVDEDTDTQPESLAYVSMYAYERKTGTKQMPPTPGRRRPVLTGDDWEEAEEKVPRLREKFRRD